MHSTHVDKSNRLSLILHWELVQTHTQQCTEAATTTVFMALLLVYTWPVPSSPHTLLYGISPAPICFSLTDATPDGADWTLELS